MFCRSFTSGPAYPLPHLRLDMPSGRDIQCCIDQPASLWRASRILGRSISTHRDTLRADDIRRCHLNVHGRLAGQVCMRSDGENKGGELCGVRMCGLGWTEFVLVRQGCSSFVDVNPYRNETKTASIMIRLGGLDIVYSTLHFKIATISQQSPSPSQAPQSPRQPFAPSAQQTTSPCPSVPSP